MAERLNCLICNDLYPPRTMRLVRNYEPENVQIALRYRQELNHPDIQNINISRVCINCDELVRRDIESLENPNHLRLQVLKQKSTVLCMICNQANNNLNRVSIDARVQVFVDTNIYIPEAARICQHHLNDAGMLPNILYNGLLSLNRPIVLSGVEVRRFLYTLRDLTIHYRNTSIDSENLSDDDFTYLTTLSKEQFDDLFTYCNPVFNDHMRNVTKQNLFIFLCKLRHGFTDEFLKILFNYPTRQSVSMIISIVRQSIMARFVPLNLGLGAITRQEFINRHVTPFSNALYNGNPEERKAIVIVDGTYAYIEKSMNFRTLRQSYSTHKGRHLVKPVLMVAPDGYIIDIHGPYFADARNNDASILMNEFQNDLNAINEWFQDGDIFIVDRGYRDAVPFLQNENYIVKTPPSLEPNQRQLPTEQANIARSITMQRWVVEARNGHIKMYRFLDGVIPYAHVLNLKDFYCIAASLINKYRNLLLMPNKTIQMANEILERIYTANVMQARVEVENLARRNAIWERLQERDIPEFPVFDLQFLHQLTQGIYQIELSPSYISDYLDHEGRDIFELDRNRVDRGLLRIRIYSRFRRATKHQLWIAFAINYNEEDRMDVADNPILGYYCTCKSGARTLGCCAHVASVLWYLGWARHQVHIKYPSQAMLDYIQDAGHREIRNQAD